MAGARPHKPQNHGKTSIEITPEIITKTERLAAQGLTEAQIGACLGIKPETVCRKKRAFSQLVTP